MSYKELKITKYNDYHGYNDEYIKRLEGYATLKTNLKPYFNAS